MVQILKPFLHDGVVVHPGDRLGGLTSERHAALARNGLVSKPDSDPDALAPPAASGPAKPQAKPQRRRIVAKELDQ